MYSYTHTHTQLIALSFSCLQSVGARRGRQPLVLPRSVLHLFLSNAFTCNEMAQCLNVSHRTVCSRLHQFGLGARRNMSTIRDVQLDRAILALKRRFPNSGYRMIASLLRINDQIIVPRARVIDPVGMARQL